MFNHCTNLSSIIFPDKITTIGSYSLAYTALTNITLKESVEVIDHSAFEYCSKLETFTIPKDSKLATIESGAFTGCSSFREIYSSCENFAIWNKALFDKDKTRLIILPPASGIECFSFPETVKKIGLCSLEETISLKAVFIPYSVNTIERYAFRNCYNLRTINIPSNVTSVEANAFEGCKKLQCGLVIENQSTEYIKMLVQTALMPRRCIQDCNFICVQSKSHYDIIPFSFIFVLL